MLSQLWIAEDFRNSSSSRYSAYWTELGVSMSPSPLRYATSAASGSVTTFERSEPSGGFASPQYRSLRTMTMS